MQRRGLSRSGLIADTTGALYGTTKNGGGRNSGTVFKLSGIGFVTSTPFASLTARLEIAPNVTGLAAGLILSSTNSNVIDPVRDPVKVKVGSALLTIPPGSFFKNSSGSFSFQGTIRGAAVKAVIYATGTSSYALLGKATGVNLSGTPSPVQVTVTIGDDSGTTSVVPTFPR